MAFVVFLGLFGALSLFALIYCCGGIFGIAGRLPFLGKKDRSDHSLEDRAEIEGMNRNTPPLPPSPLWKGVGGVAEAKGVFKAWGGTRGRGIDEEKMRNGLKRKEWKATSL